MVSTIGVLNRIWAVPLVVSVFTMVIPSARATGAAPEGQGRPAPKALDFVIFKNGDRVTGKLVTASYESVTFHGNATGDLTWTGLTLTTLR